MANTLITSSMITNETLRILHNESIFLPRINKQYNDQFAKTGAKAGATVNVRRPVQFTVRSGATLAPQDIQETQVPVTVDPEFGIDWNFQDFDLSLSIDRFSERYLVPAGRRLATELDSRISALYKQVYNFSGTPGTPPTTAALLLDPGTRLSNSITPTDDRYFCLSPAVQAGAVAGLSGLFNSQSELANQYKKGTMGNALGYEFGMSQTLPTHTVGAHGGTPLVNGAGQEQSTWTNTMSLVTDGWTNSTTGILKEGDVFTIADVYQVNQETKQSTGNLQQFVVRADADSGASTGPATLTISPAIITSGAYQNVDAAPADNAAITVVGTASTGYVQNLAYHKDAFTLVTVDMELPNGVDMAARSVYDGISLRFIRDYDVTNNRRICRFDILAGFAALRPEWACRVPN